ncbi:MAG: hypothetical protein CFE21_06590 [Bacteroidetes bacterium B1(2017)]|nr:MAG: hypothetical protein CFE21_06590 [Bacteroidetes bacterium B1(2017)]
MVHAQYWDLLKKEILKNKKSPKVEITTTDYEEEEPGSTHIVIISDSALVKLMRQEYLDNEPARKLKKQQKFNELSAATRYVLGDTNALKQVLIDLKGDSAELRNSIYSDLSSNAIVYEECKQLLSNTLLSSAILMNLEDTADEVSVAQIAGFYQLPGYQKAFENHLLTKGEVENGRLFYWLGEEGINTSILQWMGQMILERKFNLKKDYWIANGLESFATNNYTGNRQISVDICTKIYELKILARNEFTSLKGYASNNPAYQISNVLLKYGSENALPLAKILAKNKALGKLPNEFIMRCDRQKYEPILLEKLGDQDTYSSEIDIAIDFYKANHNPEIPIKLLKQVTGNSYTSNYEKETVVKALIDMGADSFIVNRTPYIKDEKTYKELLIYYEINTQNVEALVNDLTQIGIVETKNEVKLIDILSKDTALSKPSGSNIYRVLEHIGNYKSVSLIGNDLPLNYEPLISSFLELSKGKIGPYLIESKATETETVETYTYTVSVFANNKVYTMEPEDIGDIYDYKSISDLLNLIAGDAKLEEEFITLSFDEEYLDVIFGKRTQIEAMELRYNIGNFYY